MVTNNFNDKLPPIELNAAQKLNCDYNQFNQFKEYFKFTVDNEAIEITLINKIEIKAGLGNKNIKFNQLGMRLFLPTILSFTTFVISQPSHAEIPKANNIEAVINELKTVRNSEDLARFNGQKVKLVGYYISQSNKPKFPGNPNFKGVYIKSQIVLEDGQVVHIFPSWNKQSLRSPSEAEKYKGKIVEAIGVVEFEITSNINPQIKESFINLEELKNN